MNLTSAQMQALAAWYTAAEAARLAAARLAAEIAECPSQQAAKEAAERAALLKTAAYEAFFSTVEEGTRKIELPGGWLLKTNCEYMRRIDIRIVGSLRAPLNAHSTSLDALLRWNVTLETKAYRELTAEAKAIFDSCVTTTPGKPTLELVAPKVQL